MCVGVDANIVIVMAVFIGIDFSLIKYKSKPSQLLAFTKIKLEDFAKCKSISWNISIFIFLDNVDL